MFMGVATHFLACGGGIGEESVQESQEDLGGNIEAGESRSGAYGNNGEGMEGQAKASVQKTLHTIIQQAPIIYRQVSLTHECLKFFQEYRRCWSKEHRAELRQKHTDAGCESIHGPLNDDTVGYLRLSPD